MIKILMVNDVCDMGVSYAQAFNGFICEFKWSYNRKDFDLDTQIKWADIICYCGGSDISTSLYREERKEAHYPDEQRDLYEIGIYNYARKLEKIQIGICRGFQFLSVMNGYKLIQHIDGHDGKEHDILYDYESCVVNSYHHQGVIVSDTKIEEYFRLSGKDVGVQWHPELGGNSEKVFKELLKDNFYLFHMNSK